MALLKNSEIRTELIVDLALTVVLTVICLFISPLAALFPLLLGLGLSGLHLYLGAKRYGRIAKMAQEIDAILLDQERVLIAENEEGELAILYNELHKMTVRLREQNDALQRDKVQLTDAIADIFHQIRTPLTSMHLSLALLNDPDLPYERRLALTHELKKQTERIRWLVETLLKLSKLDAGTAQFLPETLSVDTLLRRAAEPFSIPMEVREQTLLLETNGAQAVCDPAWTVEAIGNLIKNAMEHTPAGGTVRIDARETPLFTEIVVSDNGEGFDKDDLPHLFERYYRGKNAAPESIGIGLALTRQILAAQNGTITAQNNTPRGACFTVRLYKATV